MVQLSPALEQATSKAQVEVPSVYILDSTLSATSDTPQDPSDDDDDDSEDEFFDALSTIDSELPTSEDLQDCSFADDKRPQADRGNEDLDAQGVAHTDHQPDSHTEDDWPKNIQFRRDWIDDFWEKEDAEDDDDIHAKNDNTSEATPEHPLAGLHSPRLVKSGWTNHSFIDKSDHLDVWSRHTEYSLSKCTWCTFPEDCGWPKPETNPGAPELRLTTPEGENCWLDDPVDYESLPWEKEVAKVRNSILDSM